MERSKRNPIVHHLKTLRGYFIKVGAGIKTAEIRFNDRDFHVNDILVLHEYDGEALTGRIIKVTVTDVLECDYLKEGYVMLSFQRLSESGIRVPIEIWDEVYKLYCEVCRAYELLKGAS